MNDFDQLFGRESARVILGRSRVEHVFADVILDDLAYEAVKRAATGGGLLEDAGTFAVGLHCALDGFDLTTNALKPVEELDLLVRHMRHFVSPSPLDYIVPYGI